MIMEPPKLGQKLKERREQLGLSIKDIADRLRTTERYIENLEEGRYGEFAAVVYARGFLRKLLGVLQMPDAAGLMAEFEAGWVAAFGAPEPVWRPRRRNSTWNFRFLTGKILMVVFGIAFLGGIFLLFGSRLTNFLQAPRLTLETPQDWTELTEPLVHIKGNTAKESQLTVNGREVTINESGAFDQDIELQPGLTTLEFIAENRFGKQTVVERRVVVQ